jgi:stress-induced morphogen
LKSSIEERMPGSLVSVSDVTGTGDHFQVVVVSDQFSGMGIVQQHQLVYEALRDEMNGDLHALGLKTYTPESWGRIQPRL